MAVSFPARISCFLCEFYTSPFVSCASRREPSFAYARNNPSENVSTLKIGQTGLWTSPWRTRRTGQVLLLHLPLGSRHPAQAPLRWSSPLGDLDCCPSSPSPAPASSCLHSTWCTLRASCHNMKQREQRRKKVDEKTSIKDLQRKKKNGFQRCTAPRHHPPSAPTQIASRRPPHREPRFVKS